MSKIKDNFFFLIEIIISIIGALIIVNKLEEAIGLENFGGAFFVMSQVTLMMAFAFIIRTIKVVVGFPPVLWIIGFVPVVLFEAFAVLIPVELISVVPLLILAGLDASIFPGIFSNDLLVAWTSAISVSIVGHIVCYINYKKEQGL